MIRPMEHGDQVLEFADNRLAQSLFGGHGANLSHLANRMGIAVTSRGTRVAFGGTRAACDRARRTLERLYGRLEQGRFDHVTPDMVDDALRMVADGADADADPFGGDAFEIRTKRRIVTPRSRRQKIYVKAMRDHELAFGVGPAGTGKTYLAVAMAVEALIAGRIKRIVLSRPAVEAGERLGFLPGDMRDKVDPYLRPLYDALNDTLTSEQLARRTERGEIEIAPLAFMRGRTLSDAYVILDEAQNTTPMQMKMFLTRLGSGGRMVVTGDLSQIDLPAGQRSGLHDALEVLHGVDGVGRVDFDGADVVRHALVGRIVDAYDRAGERESGT